MSRVPITGAEARKLRVKIREGLSAFEQLRDFVRAGPSRISFAAYPKYSCEM
jgi:hypothetical protein